MNFPPVVIRLVQYRVPARATGWLVALFLLLLSGLAYGVLIPWLGYYQDDWYQVWFGRAFGPGIFPAYYAGERPFIAWMYMITTSLLGYAPLSWHIFALLARWLAALSTWWLLRLIFPGRERLSFWIAVLSVVYPGFRQQYAAVIYSHYFLQYALQIFSLGAMVLAINQKARFWFWYPTALISALAGLFTSEYFFGLELIRPLVIWVVLGRAGSSQLWITLRKVLPLWWPFLAVLMLFLYWRLVIFSFPTYQPVFMPGGDADLLSLGKKLLETITIDIVELGLAAWTLPLRQFGGALTGQPISLAAVLLSIIGFVLILIFNRSVRFKEDSSIRMVDKRFSIALVLAGILYFLAAGWPFWFVDLPVDTLLNSGSRFGLSFIPGASFILVGSAGLLLPHRSWRDSILALIAALALGHHLLDADYYREVHKSQAIFFQQLAWRAPGLEPGTLVLANTFQETMLMGDNSLTAALNWIYDDNPPYELDLMLFYLPERLISGNIPALEPGIEINKQFRTATFHGDTSQALVVYYDYPRCLRVLDASRDLDLPRPLQMPRELREAALLSNLDQILPDVDPGAILPDELFKFKMPENSWCFYFEKAELARQQQNWDKITELAEDAFSGNPKLSTTFEVLPFLEGYARSGNYEQAIQLTRIVSDKKPDGRVVTNEILCATWKGLQNQNPPGGEKKTIDEMLIELGCGER